MTAPAHSPNDTHDDSIDMFDVLLTIAENIKLLILGSLSIGLVAYGLASIWPKDFQSTAVLRADAAVATQLSTASIVDAALGKLGLLEGLDEDEAEEAREKLQRNISTQVGRNDRLVTLTLTSTSPEMAQRLANEILSNVFAASKPGDVERKRLEAEKATLELQVNELASTGKTARRLLEEATPTTNAGTLASSIAAISGNLLRIQESISAIDKKMQGLTTDDLLQSPTLPKKPSGPKKGLIAVSATLLAGFCLLVFVVTRQAFRTAGTKQQQQERLDRLMQRYRIKK